MVCITVASRGELNCVCSQACWEQGFFFNALNTNLSSRHRREGPREGERTSSLWQEYVLTQPLSGPCPKSFEIRFPSTSAPPTHTPPRDPLILHGLRTLKVKIKWGISVAKLLWKMSVELQIWAFSHLGLSSVNSLVALPKETSWSLIDYEFSLICEHYVFDWSYTKSHAASREKWNRSAHPSPPLGNAVWQQWRFYKNWRH